MRARLTALGGSALGRFALGYLVFLALLAAGGLALRERRLTQERAAQREAFAQQVRLMARQVNVLFEMPESRVLALSREPVVVRAVAGGEVGPARALLEAAAVSRTRAESLCLRGAGGAVLAEAARGCALEAAYGPGVLRVEPDGWRLGLAGPVEGGGRLWIRFRIFDFMRALADFDAGAGAHSALVQEGARWPVPSGAAPRGPEVVQVRARVGERALWLESRADLGPRVLRTVVPRWQVFATVAAAAAVLALLLWRTAHVVARALAGAERAAGALARGDFSARVPEEGPAEARGLARSLNAMAEALGRHVQGLADEARDRGVESWMALDVARKLQRLAELQSRELAERNAQLSEKNAQLERASRHKSEFLANMSHELRTPLNAIIGFSELIDEGLAGPVAREQREYLQDIHRSGRHLLGLINDILDLAKIEAGRMELARERLDLRLPVREAEEMVRPLALQKQLALEVAAPGEEVACLGDAQKVRQAALNLLSNAVKFTPRGGRVRVDVARGADGGAELTVEDSGIGIDPALHAAIFEEFQQVDGSTRREHGGTGLGLALVKRFVEAMGGEVSVASRLGEGACFRVRLPPAPAEPPAPGGSDAT